MKILIDECLPRRLLRDLSDFSATTVPRQGWAGKTDREIIALAAAEFDIFITLDSNLIHQQNLRLAGSLCIIILKSASSRYESLVPAIPALISAIKGAEPGVLQIVSVV